VPAPLAWPSDAEGWPNLARSRRVEAGGLAWHVQHWEGDLDGALVLLHGSGGSTHSWAGLAPLLSLSGRAVIAPDLPGHAFTDRPPDQGFSLDGLADLVASLLRALDIRSCVVIGHSAGAAVALELARRDPGVRGVVGLCPSLITGRRVPAGIVPDLFVRAVRSGLTARFASGLVRHTRSLEGVLRSTGSDIPEASMLLYRRLIAAPAHVSATLTLFSQWRADEVEARLPGVDLPCLLVAGAEDDWIPLDDVRRAVELLPAARLVTLEGLGHLAHEEAPERVARVVEPFIDALVDGRLTRPPPAHDARPPEPRA
jgi:magnesium chelatase accessory protein